MGYFPSNPARWNDTNIQIIGPDGVIKAILDTNGDFSDGNPAVAATAGRDVFARRVVGGNLARIDDSAGQFDMIAGAGRGIRIATGNLVPGPLLEMPDYGNTFKGSVTTVDATVTTVTSWTPAISTELLAVARITARRTDVLGTGAGYFVCATFRTSAGGVVTQIGVTTVLAAHEDVAAWDGTLDTDGTIIRTRVTGVAANTINWDAYFFFIQES